MDVRTVVFSFCKQKTAYELRISDWSSDVCSSDLTPIVPVGIVVIAVTAQRGDARCAAACVRPRQHSCGASDESDLHAVAFQIDGRQCLDDILAAAYW